MVVLSCGHIQVDWGSVRVSGKRYLVCYDCTKDDGGNGIERLVKRKAKPSDYAGKKVSSKLPDIPLF
jgi:hypothetical protein